MNRKIPEKNIPKAIHSIFWRILLFYIGAFVVIGFLIPYDDPNLLNSSVENVAISPFTLVLDRFGFAFAASFINAIILTAVLSAGNSGLYASTRMLYAMAKEGDAPKVFTKLNSRGVPVPALLATAAFGVFAFLTSLIGEGTAYNWLINISGMSGFICHGSGSCPLLIIASVVHSMHRVKAWMPFRLKPCSIHSVLFLLPFYVLSSLPVRTIQRSPVKRLTGTVPA